MEETERQVVALRAELAIAAAEILKLRRQLTELDGDFDDVVERVSHRISARFYEEVGKSVIRKALWLVGVAAVVLLTWLGLTGKIKIGGI
jgi:uncharacterized membrane protein YdfJ with MMPL/SSD domain